MCMASTEGNAKRSGAFEVCRHMCMVAQRKMRSEAKHLESVNRQGTGGAASSKLGRRVAGCRAKRDSRQQSDGAKLVYILNDDGRKGKEQKRRKD